MATACMQCNRAFPQVELLVGLCSDCRPEAPKLLSPLTIAALVAGAVPFFFHLTSSSSVTENGVVTQAVYRDYAAIGGGAAGAVLGGVAALAALRGPAPKLARLGIALGALALGLVQLTRGFGI